jgi:predicted nucleotidyltransferase
MAVSLPPPVQAALDELLGALKGVFADDLACVMLHGSAARGDYQEGESDVDLIIVLRDDNPEKLEAIGGPLQLARFSARIEGILLLSSEIEGASDVFPLMYRDVADEGVALVGENPFKGISPSKEHVRLRVEQELREARMRLRRSVAEARGEAPVLRKVLEQKYKQLRSPLRAMLRSFDAEAPNQLPALYAAVCKRYDVDPKPLEARAKDPRAAVVALSKVLDKALAEVDKAEAT